MKNLRHSIAAAILLISATSWAAPGRLVMLQNFLEGPYTPRTAKEMLTYVEVNLPVVQMIHDCLFNKGTTPANQIKLVKLLAKIYDLDIANLQVSRIESETDTAEQLIQRWLVEVLSDKKFDLSVREVAAEELMTHPTLSHVEKDKRLIGRLANALVDLSSARGRAEKLYFEVAKTLGKVAGCEYDMGGLRSFKLGE